MVSPLAVRNTEWMLLRERERESDGMGWVNVCVPY